MSELAFNFTLYPPHFIHIKPAIESQFPTPDSDLIPKLDDGVYRCPVRPTISFNLAFFRNSPDQLGHLRHQSLHSGRKETVLDLAKFVDKGVQVKLTGGRQVTGTLKGYDQLLNLVLDEAIEFLRGKQVQFSGD
ncbi:hypothetical protein RJ639_020248 [Escallonia herrerae]|uniref:Sm domain-containing protein n=1 Tax=Escallonia herrerae TaxID=1293975 RepID=A0AA88V518_9ASTE|nr:hypothetical protein RJ639_020248 [Escallonia herrerae]